ncbi:MAG: transcription termination/antitermination protein NusA, partial [Nitrospirae bacterium]|nr:transcription termination/antitermination protein NusA [Nitrospirota bacterium]
MNRDLINIIEQMSRERGIPKEALLGTLESALLSAARKKYGITANIGIKIDHKTGKISISTIRKIVQTVANSQEEISLPAAQKIDATKRIDDEIETPLDLVD